MNKSVRGSDGRKALERPKPAKAEVTRREALEGRYQNGEEKECA